jgi:hypothetical protein
LQKAGHGVNRYPTFVINARHQEQVAKLKKWAGDKACSVYTVKNSKGITVMVFDAVKGENCTRICGKYAAEKTISPEVFQWSEKLRQAFFNGYMDGDGCLISTRGHHHAKSVSLHLASQMRFIAESLGARTCFYRREPSKVLPFIGTRQIKSARTCYATDLYDEDSCMCKTVFYNELEYFIRRVKQIDKVPYVGDVVNLCVEGNHTFQTVNGMTHNTSKPIDLLEYLLANSSKRGDIVIDTFGGSGSTLIACERLDRVCRMVELQPSYADVIRRRWAEFVHGKDCDWQSLTPVIGDIEDGKEA